MTVRVKPKTAGKLRAEAEQSLKEERRLRPERKRPNIGKVLDELANLFQPLVHLVDENLGQGDYRPTRRLNGGTSKR
jgi:hypothetical protein